MTLRSVIGRHYATPCTFIIGNDINADIDAFAHLDKKRRTEIQLLMGHMSFGLHEYFEGNVKYVTMLRDPVERVLSEYRFLKTNIRHPFHSTVAPMSLPQYLDSDFTGQSSNGQTRLLCGSHVAGKVGIAGREPLDQSSVERALENIDKHFVIAGIQEQFEESLLLLSGRLGWRIWPFYLTRNMSNHKSEAKAMSQPDDAVRSMIEERNTLDISLYRSVVERLGRDIAAAEPHLRRSVVRFVRLNGMYQQLESRRLQYRQRIRNLKVRD
ncbi:MAG: hypothetical protein DHS20C01_11800 [marine bacterium B5-7]|nr:MAG: hypothetical protein DHS20C01_11800 [marine bacterium B5-7]